MRRIKQMMVRNTSLWVITDDGLLWKRCQTNGEPGWQAIEGPPDGDPFKRELTPQQVVERMKRNARR